MGIGGSPVKQQVFVSEGGEKERGFVKRSLRHGAGRALAGKGKRVLLGSRFGLEAE